MPFSPRTDIATKIFVGLDLIREFFNHVEVRFYYQSGRAVALYTLTDGRRGSTFIPWKLANHPVLAQVWLARSLDVMTLLDAWTRYRDCVNGALHAAHEGREVVFESRYKCITMVGYDRRGDVVEDGYVGLSDGKLDLCGDSTHGRVTAEYYLTQARCLHWGAEWETFDLDAEQVEYVRKNAHRMTVDEICEALTNDEIEVNPWHGGKHERLYVNVLPTANGSSKRQGYTGGYVDVKRMRFSPGTWSGAKTRNLYGDQVDAVVETLVHALRSRA